MGVKRKALGGLALGGIATELASLAGNETATTIVESVAGPVQKILEGIDFSNIGESISGFVGENAPLSDYGVESVAPGALYGILGSVIGNFLSKELGKFLNLQENKVDDRFAGVFGALGGVGAGIGSLSLATTGLTGLSYVGSKKIIEKVLGPKYSFLAKYIALAPAGFVASTSGLVDGTSLALGAGAIIFGVNSFPNKKSA